MTNAQQQTSANESSFFWEGKITAAVPNVLALRVLTRVRPS